MEVQDDLAEVEADTAISLITLYKALGGGWQIRLGQLPTADVVMQQPTAQEPVEPVEFVAPPTPEVQQEEAGL